MSAKRVFRVGRAALAAGFLAAAVTATPASAATEMKIGSPTINETLHYWMKLFKEKIEAQTDQIKVSLYPASQLGSIPRMIEGVQLGTIEAALIPPSFLTGIDKRYGVLDAPNLLTEIEQASRAVNDFGFLKLFAPIGEPKGIKLLAIACDTPTDYALKTPISGLDDFKGRKIRIFGAPIEREMMSVLGATGVPMPLSEVLPALQQGVIDGNKAAITVFVAFKYYNVAPSLFRPKESMICPMKMVSKRWFDRLPKDQQALITKVGAEANVETIKYSVTFVEKAYEVWKKNGGTISELSPAEQKAFAERVEPIGAKLTADDPGSKALYEALKAASARSRAN